MNIAFVQFDGMTALDLIGFYGDVITGGGVATSIDLGLYVVECLTDAATARKT